MRLNRVRYHNWCQHEDRQLDFHPGVNALVGANGSGKTNAMNGIVWALTGNDRNVGVKADNVYQLAQAKCRSGVVLDASHAGVDFVLERWIKPDAKQQLTIKQTGETLTADAKIRERLISILGVPEKMLLDYVFVGQGKVDDFLSQTDTARSEAFGRLFGIEHIERIYKALGDVHIDVPTVMVDGTVVAARLQQVKAERDQAQQASDGYVWLPDPWSETNDPDTAVVRAYANKTELENQLKLIDIPALSQQLQEFDTLVAAKQAEIDSIKAFIASNQENADEARRMLGAWDSFNRTAKLRQSLDAEEARYATVPREPVPLKDYIKDDHPLLKSLSDGMVLWKNKIQAVSSITSGKSAVCPTCGTDAEHIRDHVGAWQKDLRKCEEGWRELERTRQESRQYDAQMADYRRAVTARNEALTRIASQRAGLSEIQQPTIDQPTLQEAVREHKAFVDGLPPLNQELINLVRKRADVVARHEQAISNDKRLRTSAEAISYTLEDANQASHRLAQKRQAATNRNSLNIKISLLNNAVNDCEETLKNLERDRAKRAAAESASRHLAAVRTVFHRDNLAKQVIQYHLNRTKGDVNEMLERFDNPFRLVDTSGLKLTVRFADGRVQPAERLSKGQRGVFSLAFRVAINSLFAKDLGLLCLDEPTEGLDADNTACLGVALEKLRDWSKSRGLQVLLVTHDRGLNLFDRVFDFSAGR